MDEFTDQFPLNNLSRSNDKNENFEGFLIGIIIWDYYWVLLVKNLDCFFLAYSQPAPTCLLAIPTFKKYRAKHPSFFWLFLDLNKISIFLLIINLIFKSINECQINCGIGSKALGGCPIPWQILHWQIKFERY